MSTSHDALSHLKVQLPENQIRQLCQMSREKFLEEPMLLELEAPVNIVGDIHGQFADLIRHFETLGYPPQSNYLFLGDYVDRSVYAHKLITAANICSTI